MSSPASVSDHPGKKGLQGGIMYLKRLAYLLFAGNGYIVIHRDKKCQIGVLKPVFYNFLTHFLVWNTSCNLSIKLIKQI
jgi:hypothetical protein